MFGGNSFYVNPINVSLATLIFSIFMVENSAMLFVFKLIKFGHFPVRFGPVPQSNIFELLDNTSPLLIYKPNVKSR